MSRRRKPGSRWSGMPDLERTLKSMPETVKAEVRPVIAEVARRVSEDAKSLVPVRTGALKRFINRKAKTGGLLWYVGFSAKKWRAAWRKVGWRAHFVEFGTVKKGARPFLRPAIAKNLDYHRNAIAEAVRRGLRKAGA